MLRDWYNLFLIVTVNMEYDVIVLNYRSRLGFSDFDRVSVWISFRLVSAELFVV